jgi:hypothetical protein
MLSRQELLGLGDYIKQMEDIKRKDAEIEAEKVRKAQESYQERKDYFERKLEWSYKNGLYDKRVVKEVIANSSEPDRLYLVILEKYLEHLLTGSTLTTETII